MGAPLSRSCTYRQARRRRCHASDVAHWTVTQRRPERVVLDGGNARRRSAAVGPPPEGPYQPPSSAPPPPSICVLSIHVLCRVVDMNGRTGWAKVGPAGASMCHIVVMATMERRYAQTGRQVRGQPCGMPIGPHHLAMGKTAAARFIHGPRPGGNTEVALNADAMAGCRAPADQHVKETANISIRVLLCVGAVAPRCRGIRQIGLKHVANLSHSAALVGQIAPCADRLAGSSPDTLPTRNAESSQACMHCFCQVLRNTGEAQISLLRASI